MTERKAKTIYKAIDTKFRDYKSKKADLAFRPDPNEWKTYAF